MATGLRYTGSAGLVRKLLELRESFAGLFDLVAFGLDL